MCLMSVRVSIRLSLYFGRLFEVNLQPYTYHCTFWSPAPPLSLPQHMKAPSTHTRNPNTSITCFCLPDAELRTPARAAAGVPNRLFE